MLNSRAVNLILFGAILCQFVTGLLGLLFSSQAWQVLFLAHNANGILIIALLYWKGQASLRSLARRPGHGGQKILSLASSFFLLLTLATGLLWVLRLTPVRALGGITLLSLHIYISAVLGMLFAVHAFSRWPRTKRVDLLNRRAALGMGAAGTAAVAGWWLLEQLSPIGARAQGLQQVVGRRFTGSRNAQAEWGLDPAVFPQTQLLVDNPEPVAIATWQLRISGNVTKAQSFRYDFFTPYTDPEHAVLDCTSGWYSEQNWSGIRMGKLLDLVEPAADAKVAIFHSITGYAWPIPLAEARDGLLATQVGGAPLSHSHGYPLRIVLPGRRGLQWVKWLSEIEIL